MHFNDKSCSDRNSKYSTNCFGSHTRRLLQRRKCHFNCKWSDKLFVESCSRTIIYDRSYGYCQPCINYNVYGYRHGCKWMYKHRRCHSNCNSCAKWRLHFTTGNNLLRQCKYWNADAKRKWRLSCKVGIVYRRRNNLESNFQHIKYAHLCKLISNHSIQGIHFGRYLYIILHQCGRQCDPGNCSDECDCKSITDLFR